MFRNEESYKLPLSKNTYRKIKITTGTTIDIEKYVNDCINEYKEAEDGNGLFNTDGKYFWSESLLKRMTKMEEVSEKRKKAGQKGAKDRWKKTEEDNSKNEEAIAKNSKRIANAITYNGKCYKNYGKPIAKNGKIKSKSKIKYKNKDIDIDKILSIYPSPFLNEKENELTMDKMDEMEFREIIKNSQVELYDKGLREEIINILAELYADKQNRNKLKSITVQHIDAALNNFAKANSTTEIKKPKAYFKKCLISALEELKISNQYITNGGSG